MLGGYHSFECSIVWYIIKMSQNLPPSNSSQMVVTGTIDLVAGSLGGMANVMVGQPLDTLKVKMQTFPKLYPNAVQCFKSTLKSDGIIRGLYAGTTPALVANVAENSVLFYGYGICQDLVMKVQSKNQSSTLDKAFSGFLAAFFSSFTLCPTELIKCKLQAMRETSQIGHQISAFKLTSQILNNEGIPGLFKGLTSTMFREMPGYFFFFGGYELSKSAITRGHPEKAGLLETVVSGGIGGICLWTAIFPFDVAKSRIQVDSLSDSMTKVLKDVVRKEGISGLYKGLTPTLLRTFPSTGALFVAYEYSKNFMNLGAEKIGLLS